jgi:hypothetical protein
MLMTTLHAEIARLDGEIASLTRARFAALARCDQATAGKLWRELCKLRDARMFLVGDGPPDDLFTKHE